MKTTNQPRRLETFVFEGKAWTVNQWLGEFRHVIFGVMPEFVPYDSERGSGLLRAFGSLGDLIT
jgi:hypothetical protein